MSATKDTTKTCVAVWAIVTCSVVIACFCFLMVRLETVDASAKRAEAASILTAQAQNTLAEILADSLEQSNRILERR